MFNTLLEVGMGQDWALTVVPDGGFVVLISPGHLTLAELQAMKQEVPYALRERVLVAGGFRLQSAPPVDQANISTGACTETVLQLDCGHVTNQKGDLGLGTAYCWRCHVTKRVAKLGSAVFRD